MNTLYIDIKARIAIFTFMVTLLHEFLRRRTKELGPKDVDVARKIGVEGRTYAYYVEGKNKPPLDKLVKICNVLQTSPNELLGFSVEKFDSKILKQSLLEAEMILSTPGKRSPSIEDRVSIVCDIYEILQERFNSGHEPELSKTERGIFLKVVK